MADKRSSLIPQILIPTPLHRKSWAALSLCAKRLSKDYTQVFYVRCLAINVSHDDYVSLTVTSLLVVIRNLIKPFWPCGECIDVPKRKQMFMLFSSCRDLLHPLAGVRSQRHSLIDSCRAVQPPQCTHWSWLMVPSRPSAKTIRANGLNDTFWCWLGGFSCKSMLERTSRIKLRLTLFSCPNLRMWVPIKSSPVKKSLSYTSRCRRSP